MSAQLRRAAAAATLLGLLALPGCANTPLSGAGQMRIDVAVYKGPLSKEPDVQWGELLGVIEEAWNGMIALETSALDYARYSFESDVAGSHKRSIDSTKARTPTIEESLGLRWCAEPKQLVLEKDAPTIDFSSFKSFLRSATAQLDFYDRLGQYQDARYRWGKTLQTCKRLLTLYSDIHDARTLVEDLVADSQNWSQWYSSNLARISDTYIAALSRIRRNAGGNGELDVPVTLEKCRTGDTTGCPDNDLRQLVQETDNLAVEMRSTLKEVARVGYRLKQKAVTWAGHHLKNAEPDLRARQIQTAFSIIGAEYANQMVAKADALLKQTQPGGNDRQALPLSVHLRDASSTSFTSLALQQHAVGAPLDQEAGSADYALNRLQVFEKLYDDDNWSRINTVHAVGRGEVRMAFIKDEIGNWNLKRFDNDPTELLNAYKDVGIAALKAATSVVGGAGGVSGAQQLLGLANQVALGGAPASAPALGNKTVTQLHQGVVDRLNRLKADMSAKRTTLTTEIETLDATVKTRQEAVAETTTGIEAKVAGTGGKTAAGQQAEALAQARLATLLRERAAAAAGEQKTELEAQAQAADDAARAAKGDADRLTGLEAEIAQLKKIKAEREADAAKAVTARDGKKAELDTLAKSTAEQADLVLERHGLIVDELESATVAEPGPAAGVVPASAPAANPLGSLFQ